MGCTVNGLAAVKILLRFLENGVGISGVENTENWGILRQVYSKPKKVAFFDKKGKKVQKWADWDLQKRRCMDATRGCFRKLYGHN